MYRRYSQVSEGQAVLSQMKRSRIKTWIILFLVAVIAALCAIGIPALRSRGEGKSLYMQRMRSECEEAIRQTSVLSRNAGADSAAILARIRSNLYAIRTMNALSAGQGYGTLLPDESLLSIQESVDRYLSFLTTGMDTGEYQTALQNSLETLRTTMNEMEN